MKKIVLLISVILALLIAIPAIAKKKVTKEDEYSSVGAIYIPFNGGEAAVCSGVLTGYDGDGDGIFLTARHCVWDEDNTKFRENESVSFSDDESGPYYPTSLYAVSLHDDIAFMKVIGLHAQANTSTAIIEDEHFLTAGDPIENISFPEDSGKVEFFGRFVAPAFLHFPRDYQGYPEWYFGMPIDITITRGSSGSPIFDSNTRNVIGIVVGTFDQAGYEIAIPSSRIIDLALTINDNTPEKFLAAHKDDKPVMNFIWQIFGAK